MEKGSSSRRSWADVVDASSPALPPLAAATHASLVLRATNLDPDAEPFFASPDASERLHLSDYEGSFGDSDEPPSSGRVDLAARPRRLCRRRRRRARPCRANLEPPLRTYTPPPGHPPRMTPPPAHPPRMSPAPDGDGFREVHSRRRWRRATVVRKPVPANLVSKCFNCLSETHVKAECTFPSRCFSCLQEGHQERNCTLRGGKRGRSPGRNQGSLRGGRRRCSPSRLHRAASADTASGHSVSTGWSPSVPPVCAPPSLGPSRLAPPPHGAASFDLGRERQC